MDTNAPAGQQHAGTKKTVKEITYMEEDNSPDYLLPSNGGYNPKQKTIFQEEIEQFGDDNEALSAINDEP